MKRRLLLAALVLTVVGLFWWLARHETSAPLVIRFLHRTNNSLGEVRYLLAVTNQSREMAFGEFNGRCYLPPKTAAKAGAGEVSFSDFEVGGGREFVLSWQPTSAQSRRVVLRYGVRGTLTSWKEWLHEKISPGTIHPRDFNSNSLTILIDLPPD
jgi:hypothetical protein